MLLRCHAWSWCGAVNSGVFKLGGTPGLCSLISVNHARVGSYAVFLHIRNSECSAVVMFHLVTVGGF